MADYFWSPTSLYLFSFQCCWLWETTNRLKSINKCFMYITQDCKSTWRHLQQEDKGKLCIVIHAKINYIPIYQNQPVCLKQMLNYQRLWAWCQLCYISQELILFTYTVVIKKGKLQHAAVYIGSTTCHKEVTSLKSLHDHYAVDLKTYRE